MKLKSILFILLTVLVWNSYLYAENGNGGDTFPIETNENPTILPIRRIVRKGEGIQELPTATNAIALLPKEKDVVKLLYEMPNTIVQAAASYSPAMIANYAFELAKAFNSFYQDTPILREENNDVKAFRVKLCHMVSITLKNTMKILGIDVPERM